MITRRGWLGGIFAVVAGSVIPASTGSVIEPRYWIKLKFQTIMEAEDGFGRTDYQCIWTAIRADGMCFFTTDSFSVTPGSSAQAIAAATLSLKHDLRIALNDYLDSECACSRNFVCPKHQNVRVVKDSAMPWDTPHWERDADRRARLIASNVAPIPQTS